MAEPVFCNIDETALIGEINRARQRVVLVAPGVTKPIAEALGHAWQRLGARAVSVIFDVDPEVCRLGYGTLEGLEAIQGVAAGMGEAVCHQPGVRICLLVSDSTTLVFSPTPLLVEAGSTHGQHPNGIRFDITPPQLEQDLGITAQGESTRIIGLDSVPPAVLAAVKSNLNNNPPVKFDLARKVRVFNSRFQFVELEMTGCFISKKKVPIPSNLMGLAKDKQTQERLHASFDLVGKTELSVKVDGKIFSEDALRRRKAEIVKRFLISLAVYGSVILRSNKEEFQKEVELLRDEITGFQNAVKAKLQKHIDSNRDAVAVALLPGVKQNPPDHYTKIHGSKPSEAALKKMLAREIAEAFGTAGDVVEEMKVTLLFKDVAYESLVDFNFIEIARKAMPGVDFLHEEFDAAKTSTQGGCE